MSVRLRFLDSLTLSLMDFMTELLARSAEDENDTPEAPEDHWGLLDTDPSTTILQEDKMSGTSSEMIVRELKYIHAEKVLAHSRLARELRRLHDSGKNDAVRILQPELDTLAGMWKRCSKR